MISDVRGIRSQQLPIFKDVFKVFFTRLHLLGASITGGDVSREVHTPSDASNALIQWLPRESR